MLQMNEIKLQSGWQHFDHSADIGVRGIGVTKAESFAQAAIAMTGVMTEPRLVAPVEVVEIFCKAPEADLLFIEWMNALVYEMATRKMLFSRFDIQISKNTLAAKAWGEPVDIERHHPAVEIKGATFTALSVQQENDGRWIAQCVVDV